MLLADLEQGNPDSTRYHELSSNLVSPETYWMAVSVGSCCTAPPSADMSCDTAMLTTIELLVVDFLPNPFAPTKDVPSAISRYMPSDNTIGALI